MRFLRRNVLLVYGVYAVTLVSGLVVTPIIVKELGTEQYGLWSFIGSLGVFVTLLDFGLGPTVIRFAAEQRGRGAPEETSALASTGLAIYLALAGLTAALAAVLAWLLPAMIDLPESLVGPGRIALLLVVAGFVVRFPLSLFGNLLAGQQRYDVINFASLASATLYAVLVAVLFLSFGGGIVLLAAVTFAATVLRLALPVAWLRRELPALRVRRSLASRLHARELLGFSWHNFLIQIASKVVLSTDVIVVGVVLGTFAAGLYAVPAKLFALALGVGAAAATLLFPVLAELEGAEERERQRAYLLSGVRVGVAVVLLAAMPLLILPDRFLEAWLGADYREGGFEDSVPVLVVLMVSILFVQPATMLTQFLVARGRHARLALVRLGTVVANLALSIVLATAVGIWGVAVATLATEALAVAVVLPLLVRRAAPIDTRELVAAWARPVLVAAAAAAPTLALLGRGLPVDTLPEIGAVGLAWAGLFGTLLWRFGLDEGERTALRRAVAPARVAAPAPAAVEEPG